MEFTQPNGTKFYGFHEGDEYESIYRTEDEYTFVCRGSNGSGPYEYAALNANGDLIGSGKLVGIDPPLSSSYMLGREGAAKDAINSAISAINNSLFEAVDKWRDTTIVTCSLGVVLSINVGIILVEFPDRLHVSHFDNSEYPKYVGQTTENIETMMNSIGTYFGQQPPEGQGEYNESLHPTRGQMVCGSFRDYWRKASYGLWDTPFTIINPRDNDGEAIWLQLSHGQREYGYAENNRKLLPDSALARARERNWPVDAYDIIIVMNPGPIDSGDVGYCLPPMGNQTTPPSLPIMLWDNAPIPVGGRFTQIGVPVHEFGHVLGLWDFRGSGFASLMAQGNCAGPDANSWQAAPTGLGAYNERELGFFYCFSRFKNSGGIIHLGTNGGQYRIPVRSSNGHVVFSMGGFDADHPEYLLEARSVNYELAPTLCGEIDDRMIMPGEHQIPEGTDHTQLVIWDITQCGDLTGESNQVVRSPKSSTTYLYDHESNGGRNFWYLWPGSVTHFPNAVNWTPFTFPNVENHLGVSFKFSTIEYPAI